MKTPAALLLLLSTTAPAWADGPPKLGLPLDCRLGETCWVMNYPDTAPGPEAKDFACRPRTYDGHEGTDIALRDMAAQKQGVAVLAAAAGKVITVRDGEPDGLWMAGRTAKVKAGGKECGNRVGIAHGDGWATDYCHLRRGSVTVKPGDLVQAGQPIGQVGLSGMTEFPHAHMALMHFEAGQQQGTPVDPATGEALAAGCGKPAHAVWSLPMPYQAVSLYAAGFADTVPKGAAIMASAKGSAHMPPNAAALVLWGALFGAAAGDRVSVTIAGPDGTEVLNNTQTMDKDQAWRFVAVGKKRTQPRWPAGTYKGTITLERDGMAPQQRDVHVAIP